MKIGDKVWVENEPGIIEEIIAAERMVYVIRFYKWGYCVLPEDEITVERVQ